MKPPTLQLGETLAQTIHAKNELQLLCDRLRDLHDRCRDELSCENEIELMAVMGGLEVVERGL